MREELRRVTDEWLSELEDLLRAKFADEEESPLAVALQQSLREIMSRNGKLLTRLVERLGEEEKGKDLNNIFRIVTVFAPASMRGELKQRNLFLMPGGEGQQDGFSDPDDQDRANLAGSLFLNCRYRDMAKYIHKDYQGELEGKPVNYTLAPYFGYIGAERMLYELALVYGIDRPVIFSPWSRRAVKLEFRSVLPKDARIDLKLQANNLQDVLLTDRFLAWNVAIEDCPRWDNSYTSPDGFDQKYIYEYTFPASENGFVLPYFADLGDAMNLPLTAAKNVARIKIEAQAELASEFRLIEILRPRLAGLPMDCQIFENVCDAEKITACSRPGTRGDINLILSALKQPKFNASHDQSTAEKETLGKYESGFAYGYRANELRLQAIKQKFRCRIEFGGEEEFLEDYAEYVLSYLARRYPEYLWTGVRH